MNHDTAVIDRLRRAAEHIDVAPDLESITAGASRLRAAHHPTPRRPHRALLVAACVALIAAGGAGVVLTRTEKSSSSGTISARWQEPSPVPRDAPPTGSVSPAVVSPPAWLNDLAPAFRDGSQRSGEWVSMAIARIGADNFDDPILASVFDGEFAALSEAETIDLNGQTFQTVQIGAWRALARGSSPTVMVEGAVELTELADVLSAVRVTTNGLQFSVALDVLPDGFDVIVAPQTLGIDATPRRTLASPGNMLAINEVSDWIDPLLYAAGIGTDITRRSVGREFAWTGTTNERVPLTFLVWSPQPSVVLEITTTDNDRSIDDLIALAEATSAIPIADWDASYPD